MVMFNELKHIGKIIMLASHFLDLGNIPILFVIHGMAFRIIIKKITNNIL